MGRLRVNVFVHVERKPLTLIDTHQERAIRPIHALLLTISLIAAACSGTNNDNAGNAATPTTPTTTTTTTTVEVVETAPEVDQTPSVPAGVVVVSNENGRVELGWDASRDETVTGYQVTRFTSRSGSESFDTTEPSFVDEEQDDGEIVSYSIAAVGTGGTSERTELLTVQVGIDTDSPTRPGAPNTLESAEGVSLQWRPSTDISGIDRYIITRILDGETSEIETAEPTLFDDVAPGSVITYAVRAVDGAGNESDNSRNVTLLSGTAAQEVVVVVSAIADPASDPSTARLQTELLDRGFTVSWFEDEFFDSNITSSEDVVLLLGDIEGQGFDWNLFGTDANTITLKSIFMVSSGILENPPKLERVTEVAYRPDGDALQVVTPSASERPRSIVNIPLLEQIPDLEVWATPSNNAEIAVAGWVPADGELANDREAAGCRAFFPGNIDSLAEQSDAGWNLLGDFVDTISQTCR